MWWNLEEVLEIVSGTIKERPLAFERLEGGTVNTILSVELETGHVIVRIPRLSECEVEVLLNRICSEYAHHLGVPAASVIDIVELSRGKFISIEERLPGSTLDRSQTVGKFSIALLREVGGAVNRLHAGKVSGFGRLDRKGVGLFPSWEAFILNVFEDESGFEQLMANRVLRAWEIDAARETLAGYARGLWDDVGRLLHGDLDYGNIMAECTRLSGLIDWGDAMSGDPFYDYIRLEFVRGPRPVRAFLRLGGEFNEDRLNGPAADCYRLRIALESALWKVKVGEACGAKYAGGVARSALRRLLKGQ